MKEQVFVGRERELKELEGHLAETLAGRGRVCFVTGQAGAGKTALVRRFVQQALATDPDLVLALGSCAGSEVLIAPALTVIGAKWMFLKLPNEAATRNFDWPSSWILIFKPSA